MVAYLWCRKLLHALDLLIDRTSCELVAVLPPRRVPLLLLRKSLAIFRVTDDCCHAERGDAPTYAAVSLVFCGLPVVLCCCMKMMSGVDMVTEACRASNV